MKISSNTKSLIMECARLYYEEDKSFTEMARKFGKSYRAVSRLLKRGKKEGIYKVNVSQLENKGDVSSLDDDLSYQLAIRQKTFFDTFVVRVSGVEKAYTEEYLSSNQKVRDQAYEANDLLHQQLGTAASRCIALELGQGYRIGICSGRAVMNSILQIDQHLKSRIDRLKDLRVFSLCGGFRIGPWAANTRTKVDFDADTAAFQLKETLRIPQNNCTFMLGPGVADDPQRYMDPWLAKFNTVQQLDLIISGFGVLNAGHYLLRYKRAYELAAAIDELSSLEQEIQKDPMWIHSVADIGHYLFWVGDGKVPIRIGELLEQLNRKLLQAPVDVFRKARQVILIGAGHQKLPVLKQLCFGKCKGVPINLDHTILITDQWTARELLKGI